MNQNDENKVLDTLSDTDIEMNYNAIYSLCSSWNSKIRSLNIDSSSFKLTFSSLNEHNILNSTISSFKENLDNILSSIDKLSLKIKSTAETQQSVDNYNQETKNNFYNFENDYSTTSRIGNTIATSVNNSNENITVNSTLLNTINQLELDNYNILLETISSLASTSVSLSTILNNKEYATIIKEALLTQNNIPENIKVLLKDMDEETIQKTLLAMFTKNTFAINTISKTVMYDYLESIAKTKNISITELLSNKDNLVNVIRTFQEVDNSINQIIATGKISESLNEIYSKNKIDNINNDSLSILKNTISLIAKNKNIEIEELVNNYRYNNYLEKEFKKASKSFSFISTVGWMNQDDAKSIIANLLLPKEA